jgi:hypothetical protein
MNFDCLNIHLEYPQYAPIRALRITVWHGNLNTDSGESLNAPLQNSQRAPGTGVESLCLTWSLCLNTSPEPFTSMQHFTKLDPLCKSFLFICFFSFGFALLGFLFCFCRALFI